VTCNTTTTAGGIIEDDRVEIDTQYFFDHQLKESSVDIADDDTSLYSMVTGLTSPVHNCVVIDNHVAMEMQESFSDNHNHKEEKSKTTLFTDINSTDTDGCSIVTNQQCKPYDDGLQPVNSKPDEPRYKPPADHRDILFPMRDQKSLSEIKKVRGDHKLEACEIILVHVGDLL